MNYDRIKQQAGHLPAFQIADAINSTLKESANLVVTAPPGAGKSTVLPLTLLGATPQGKILMLEPRRLAARQIAERMASILGEPMGKTVGYRVRFENKVLQKPASRCSPREYLPGCSSMMPRSKE